MKRVILGSNTEAKILSFLLGYPCIIHNDLGNSCFKPESTAHSKMTAFRDAMVLLHVNEYSKKFIDLLGITCDMEVANISYTAGSLPIHAISNDQKVTLLIKKLTSARTGETLYGDDFIRSISVCSNNDRKILYHDIKMSILIAMLDDEVKCHDLNHLGPIQQITANSIVFKTEIYRFDYAISTVNAKIINELFDPSLKLPSGIEFKSIPSTFYRYERIIPMKEGQNRKIVYNFSESHSYNRLWYTENTNNLIIETTGDQLPAPIIIGWNFIDQMTIKEGKIKKIPNIFIADTIEPVGRYAQWNPDVNLENVIERGLMTNPLLGLWSNQKAIHSIRMRNDIYDNSTKAKEEYTKEYILNIIDQCSKLLNQINWKKKKIGESKDVNIDGIAEEWVDIFKYWLSIGVVWGINPEEFIRIESIKHAKGMAKVKKRG